jgi:hypothetical protein
MADEYQKPESAEEAALEVHEWLFRATNGYPSNADQLVGMMKIMRGGRFSARILIWIGGGTMALIGGWNTITAALARFGGAP